METVDCNSSTTINMAIATIAKYYIIIYYMIITINDCFKFYSIMTAINTVIIAIAIILITIIITTTIIAIVVFTIIFTITAIKVTVI